MDQVQGTANRIHTSRSCQFLTKDSSMIDPLDHSQFGWLTSKRERVMRIRHKLYSSLICMACLSLFTGCPSSSPIDEELNQVMEVSAGESAGE